MMHLVSKGVITNRKKGFNEGKLVASIAIGTKELYEFLDSNPSVEFHPSDYVNDPRIISRHNKMVSMNVAMAVDLTGQVAADALPFNYYSGVSGTLDFIRGTALSEGGKSILMLTSTTARGKKSRIVPMFHDTGVVVPRGDVQYIVTEYGAVNLFGKSYQERAMAMISIAHPDFRNCESCMQWHIEQAASSGASYDEILEALEVGIEMGGGPATVSARFALQVMDRVFPN